MSPILQPDSVIAPSAGPQDWRRALASPERQWRAGYSAMAAAQSWEAAQGAPGDLPPEIAALLGPDAVLQLAVPEHKVAMPGAGFASQCDVFALCSVGGRGVALAVEAKVNETFGPTVADWYRDPSPGKQARLTTICAWLGVNCPPPGPLRYQLLHRTAAAVVEARRFRRPVAAMVVQSFSPEHRWLEDFEAFAQALGIAAGPGHMGRMVLPCGVELWLGWAQGHPRFLSDLSMETG